MATKPKSSETTDDQTDVTETENTVTDNRTTPQDFGPDNGAHNILAAWQGLYWLLGGRVESFDVTEEGVFVRGLTFNTDRVPSTDEVVHGISFRGDKFVNRDLPLIPSYFYVRGEEPTPFEDAGEMTQWMAKFFRGAGDGDTNRSPKYVKDAINSYKGERGIAARRGRPPKKIEIEALGSIDEAILDQVKPEELEKLQAMLNRYMQSSTATANA